MRLQLTSVEGQIYPVTLLGRWIDRSQGRDDAELERERRQRELQASRAGSWGSNVNGASASPGQGDPAHEAEGKRAPAATCSATASSTRCGRSRTGRRTSSTSRSTRSSG